MAVLFEKYKEVLLKYLDDIDNWMPHVSTFQSRLWFTKMIQQYEIWKPTMDLPGHVVELGVFQGESFFHWARLIEAFNMGERHTRVIGFDNFAGFTKINDKDKTTDTESIDAGGIKSQVVSGGFNPGEKAYQRVQELIEIFENDHFVPQRKRLEIVKGDIIKTVPEYVKNHPGMRISLLHLDCDLYEPTMIGLKHLYHLVVSGGAIILDEYALEKFAGETSAFDEFFGDKKPKLFRSRIANSPTGWFYKE